MKINKATRRIETHREKNKKFEGPSRRGMLHKNLYRKSTHHFKWTVRAEESEYTMCRARPMKFYQGWMGARCEGGAGNFKLFSAQLE